MSHSQSEGSGQAYGKIILAGEHAVVHGQPAIALPFSSVQLTVLMNACPDHSSPSVTIKSDYYQGYFFQKHHHLEGIQAIWKAFFEKYSYPEPHLSIQINSSIPAERGMGSSAALATAFTRALFSYFNLELTGELLNQYVNLAEKIAHGNPSGIDALIVKSNQSLFFQKNHRPRFFDMHSKSYLVVADTGQTGNTRQAVQAVSDLLTEFPDQAKKKIDSIGDIVSQMMSAIHSDNNEMLGQLMTQNHELLRALKVSNQSLDQLVQTALKSGALGAKMTGGGRGGCMIALGNSLTKAKEIAQNLENTGAKQTWLMNLNH